jgi:enoyl-CoA hydratase/carnithine racemase
MAEPVLLIAAREGIATLTLNRPAQFNALSAELLTALEQALCDVARDASARVVVLAGAGRGFCAGHDLREIRALGDARRVEALFLHCSRVMQQIVALPQPVIARVHGIATAAGCQLVASCDLAIASSAARFATPGVNIGAFCATPGVAVSRALARKHALELLLTGEPIDAERAFAIGLVNRVVAPEALDAEVERLAVLLASKSPRALRSGKRLFQRQLEAPLEEAYALASAAIASDFASPDGIEGTEAFLEKRPPVWKAPA